jgi:GT2 family glycosyltransferase
MIRVAVAMVNYRNAEDTMACLDSLAASGAGIFEVFLVENGSGDGSGGRLRAHADGLGMRVDVLIATENLGFAAASNLAVRTAMERGHSHVLFLNNDTSVEKGFAEAVRKAIADHPDAVQAGYIGDMPTSKPVYNLGSISGFTGLIHYHFQERYAPMPPFDFISCCLMLVPVAVFRRVGFLRDGFFLYCEDLEFCFRLKRAGVPLRYDPAIAIHHKVSSSVTKASFPKDYYRMRNHTYTILRSGTTVQKVLYLFRVSLTLLAKIRDPSLLRQFTAGVRDGISGRLGHNPEMRA